MLPAFPPRFKTLGDNANQIDDVWKKEGLKGRLFLVDHEQGWQQRKIFSPKNLLGLCIFNGERKNNLYIYYITSYIL